jgi:hypothetical protein
MINKQELSINRLTRLEKALSGLNEHQQKLQAKINNLTFDNSFGAILLKFFRVDVNKQADEQLQKLDTEMTEIFGTQGEIRILIIELREQLAKSGISV